MDGYGDSVSRTGCGRLGIGRPCSVASAFSAVAYASAVYYERVSLEVTTREAHRNPSACMRAKTRKAPTDGLVAYICIPYS